MIKLPVRELSVHVDTLQVQHSLLTGQQIATKWLYSYEVVVYENLFFKIKSEFCVQSTTKNYFIDDHYKTLCRPVRSESSSCRVTERKRNVEFDPMYLFRSLTISVNEPNARYVINSLCCMCGRTRGNYPVRYLSTRAYDRRESDT